MRITAKMLRDKGACPDQVELFEAWLAKREVDSIVPTAEDVRAAAEAGLDAGWAVGHGLLSRAAACGDPWAAYRYAECVDKAPRDDTRAAACGDPDAAYGYAQWERDRT